jgi:hypothetical protein
MVYLASSDRRTGFAVYKAVGVPTGQRLASLVVQTVFLALSAAALAAAGELRAALPPECPVPVAVHISVYADLIGCPCSQGWRPARSESGRRRGSIRPLRSPQHDVRL